MIPLRFNHQHLPAEAGQTLFDCADLLNLRIPSSCGRHGSCHECIVEVTEGAATLSPRTEHETFLRGNYRLACQCRLQETPHPVHVHALRRGAPQISSGGKRVDFAHDPCVTRGPANTVLLDGELIATSAGPLLGLAADVGTTTVVLRLLDLESGTQLATHSFENPQMFGGTDVMGRITYDRDNTQRDLQHVLIAYINRSIDEFAATLGIKYSDIYECVIVGNATMRDIFFGIDVRTIGERPYRSMIEQELHDGTRATTSLTQRPGRLRLRMNRKGRVWGAPLIASHVGADTVACLAAIGLDREERTVMMMDIGTNTEVLLGNRHRTICASCPAGPAFEGGAISCGMPGLEGAIENVQLNGTVRYQTIGAGLPLGLCGSGLVDALGELLRTEQLTHLGRLETEDGVFWIDRQHEIFIAERDISELAQAKAANIAGLLILLEEYGLSLDQIDCFYLAGGFAQYISAAHAVRIGMIPELPLEKIEKIGNAAIEGATMMLLSSELRRRMEVFVPTIKHIELEQHPNFFGIFVEGCQFKPSSQMVEE